MEDTEDTGQVTLLSPPSPPSPQVDTASPRHGGELVAEVLRAHGVRFLFTLPGGHISPVLVACEKIGIRVVDTRHEATAVFAADAVSRLSGRIGVAAVTAGPGVTNAVTAVKNAQMAESPLLLLGGAAATLQKVDTASPRHGGELVAEVLRAHGVRFLFTLPGGHISPVLVACEKIGIRVVDTRHEATAVFAADAVSRLSGGVFGVPPGPVFVELPIDVLYPFHVVQKEIGGSKTPRGLRGKLVQWVGLGSGFLGVPRATPQQVQLCSELLSRAQRPLVLVGSQALLPPTPAEELCSALLSLGVPCYLGGAARGLLPPECPLLLRHNRREALRRADLVLLAGTVCDFRLSYGRLFGRGAAVVAVNRDRRQLLRNSDVFWKPRLAVHGDPASLVVALSRSLQGFSGPREWLEQLRDSDRDREQRIRDKAAVPPPCHLNPLALLQALDQVLPPQSILVADGGDFVATAAYTVRPRRPLAWLDPGTATPGGDTWGHLGTAWGQHGDTALGAKLCRPEAEVWVLYGDGSLGFSLMEFDTFVRHKVAVIALVGNDAGWTQISREQLPLLGSAVGCRLSYSGE
ncbi:PREDICTED: acetolactate synthase-like protein [Sturnus vulgaris]|uniref:acetolactate synthase-like protein n=1 Tax=Sturnus vulgaris TaxID=9172 RepID=UPI00071AA305|nr:PREDICTED: acetolactate synthase-like protein [Sturnus vulgaris]